MYFKKSNVEAMEDGSIAVFINGAVRISEQDEIVFAFGSCAHLGGIPAQAKITDINLGLTNNFKIIL
jgi:F420-non-reducing hydrogenase small subunit